MMTTQEFVFADNYEYLKAHPDNSEDSIVTDSPYGLGKTPNLTEVLQAWITTGYLKINGTGFLGRDWDAFVPQPLFWKQCYRVLKPGGYALSFFSTRTYHLGVLAMQLAGFEVRDCIAWVYSQGFPKSVNVSKEIDKKLGAKRKKMRIQKGVRNIKVSGGARDGKIADGMRPWLEKAIENGYHELDDNNAITDEAKQWDGWGTGLKPAIELIVVCRKPLDGTIAENVLAYGTGCINIDACRVPFSSDADQKSAKFGRGTDITGGKYKGATESNGQTNIEANPKGRWPANIILDEGASQMLDDQSGILKSGSNCVRTDTNRGQTFKNLGKPGQPEVSYGDIGGASRFFYCPKPSRSERNKGLEDKSATQSSLFHNATMRNIEDTDWSARNGNDHETVKPIKLMRYLVKMVTPVGGRCLDPHNGSGSTGIACKLENINYIGIDNIEKNIRISKARCDAW